MATDIQTCPDHALLENFAFGNLSGGEIDAFEGHLSTCDSCLEKIESFKPKDTLYGLTKIAFDQISPNQIELETEDNETVARLIAQMRDIPNMETRCLATETVAEIEDRAAEVQRLLKPSDVEGNLGRIKHFEIESILGCGSTSIVYLATNSELDRHVALKVLRPSLGGAARERFVIEAKSAARISNANVVQIYEVGSEDKLAYIAMSWTPGETLEQKLAREKSLSPQKVRLLGKRIADGLAAAHSAGVIHRDIKPANVWIEDEAGDAGKADLTNTTQSVGGFGKLETVTNAEESIGAVQILDFGLVRVTDANPKLTCTGMIAGTPCFMSPEQSKGGDLDERSDFFSLGCLLYRAATGQLPFESNNALATLQSIQRDVPHWPHELEPNIPLDLSTLIMCLLEKSPSDRPPSASEISKAIVSKPEHWGFTCDQPAQATVQANPQRTNTKSDDSTWRRWFIGLFAAGFFGFTALFFPQIIRIAMDQGELVIKTSDPNVRIEVLEKGERVELIDLKTKQSITIRSGEYQLKAMSEKNTVFVDKQSIVLKRGGQEIVTVSNVTKELAEMKGTEKGFSIVDLQPEFQPKNDMNRIKDKIVNNGGMVVPPTWVPGKDLAYMSPLQRIGTLETALNSWDNSLVDAIEQAKISLISIHERRIQSEVRVKNFEMKKTALAKEKTTVLQDLSTLKEMLNDAQSKGSIQRGARTVTLEELKSLSDRTLKKLKSVSVNIERDEAVSVAWEKNLALLKNDAEKSSASLKSFAEALEAVDSNQALLADLKDIAASPEASKNERLNEAISEVEEFLTKRAPLLKKAIENSPSVRPVSPSLQAQDGVQIEDLIEPPAEKSIDQTVKEIEELLR